MGASGILENFGFFYPDNKPPCFSIVRFSFVLGVVFLYCAVSLVLGVIFFSSQTMKLYIRRRHERSRNNQISLSYSKRLLKIINALNVN